MKTVKDVFAGYKNELKSLYDISETEALTLLVISEVSKIPKASIKAFPEKELDEAVIKRLSEILPELKMGKPIQYILGQTEFYGLPFNVNPSVLIPRPETEELVEWIITTCNEQSAKHDQPLNDKTLLDIGTGSGCIAICLKKNLTEFSVSAIDISAEALKTATGNAELNDVNVNFINTDILNIDADLKFPAYEIIVSNPPYVTLHDKTQMHTNVTDFEPHTALFVPEHDPLLFYNAIADFAMINLTANGLLFFEINESFGKETIQLLAGKGFKNIALRKDMSGRDRMIKANK